MTAPMIEAMSAVSFLPPAQPVQLSGITADAFALSATSVNPASHGFASMVGEGLTNVNQKLMAGQVSLQRLASGDVQNLHEVMMSLEETRLSFQLVMQVRNRVLEAYQDIMKMQV